MKKLPICHNGKKLTKKTLKKPDKKSLKKTLPHLVSGNGLQLELPAVWGVAQRCLELQGQRGVAVGRSQGGLFRSCM